MKHQKTKSASPISSSRGKEGEILKSIPAEINFFTTNVAVAKEEVVHICLLICIDYATVKLI